MTTSSTVPAVEAALVTQWGNALPAGVGCYRAWPGPASTAEMAFLTDVDWDEYGPATATGAQRRDEFYRVGFEVWVFGHGSPTNAGVASDRAMSHVGDLEVVLAESPRLGLPCVLRAVPNPGRKEVLTFEKGWAVAVTGTVDVRARLTE